MQPTLIFLSGTILLVLLNMVISAPRYRPMQGQGNYYEPIAPNRHVSRFSALFNTILFMLLLWFAIHHLPAEQQVHETEKTETVAYVTF